MEEFDLEEGEKILLSVRKHWFVFFCELLPFALAAWLPLYLPTLFSALMAASPNSAQLLVDFSFANPWVRLAYSAWWFVLWILAFNIFTQYFLNMWIITNRRIVSIHQWGFFSRQVTSFLLSHVQDVTTTIDGFFATLIHFGTVRAETAGESAPNFYMTGIPDPTGIRDLIMNEIAELHGDRTPSSSV